MRTTERRLREFVRRAVLAEDGEYADLAMADAGNPYGGGIGGSGADLYHIFVQPFVDVVSTAAGKTKELSQKGQTLLHVAFETIATSLIPVLEDSYGEIFAKEKEELDKIKQQYSEVYQSNWDAFKNNDVLVTAFMYAPAAFITADLATKSPKVAAKLISVLSGGSLDGWLKRVAAKFSTGAKSHANTPVHGAGGDPITDAHLHEDEQGSQQTVAGVLGGQKLRDKLAGQPLVKQMQQQGRATVRGSLTKVYKEASAVLKATSLQQLQGVLHKPIKGTDKLSQLPQQERGAAEQAILKGTKASMKSFYVKSLEAQVKQAADAGVAQDNPYVVDLNKVVSKIKAL